MYFHSKIAYFLCSTQELWPFSSVLEILQTFFTYCFLLNMNLLLGLECSTWFISTFHNTYVILKKPPSESKLLYIMTESLSRHRKVLSKVLGREREGPCASGNFLGLQRVIEEPSDLSSSLKKKAVTSFRDLLLTHLRKHGIEKKL